MFIFKQFAVQVGMGKDLLQLLETFIGRQGSPPSI